MRLLTPSIKPSALWQMLSDEQRCAATFALERKGSGLFLEPGVGKTHTALAIIEQLMPMKTVIFCKITNRETTWINTIKEVLPGFNPVDNLPALIASGTHSILLVNIEKFTSQKRQKKQWAALLRKLRKLRFDAVFIDESQGIKGRSSVSNNVACRFRSDFRVALTGTPMDQHHAELWAQMKFINAEAFGTSWKEFDQEYLTQPTVDPTLYPPGSTKWKEMMLVARIQRNKATIRPEMVDQFHEILQENCIYIDKQSLGLESADQEILFDLSPAERKAYDQMEKEAFVRVNGSIIKGALAITKNGKLAQIPGGSIINEDGEVEPIGGYSKARQLERLIPKLRIPFLVFALYRHELELVEELLRDSGLVVKTISGKTEKKKARPKILREFQDYQLDALVIQNKTGGVGVDLFEACDAVIFSQSHSRIDDQQLRARMERRGQLRKMRFIYLIARDTIDQDKRTAIKTKKKLTDVILERLKNKIK